ncbi:uncharacterized protein LOC110106667 [Dendrobium catenatum]|uniref:uncharacterized protein LOC110106667 n=1 Tax=Dendrobium catenatum TaxID=906689 RepID=UPI0009F2B602|nr:uncharacterized protein LOC110106667 [Dendrobium catenatum]
MLTRYSSPWKPCPPSLSSGFWKSICSTADKFKSNFCFQVGLNSPIDCFWDNWVLNDSISSMLTGQASSSVIGSNDKLANWVTDGVWSIPTSLNTSLKNLIYIVPISHISHYHITWENNENATFKDFYKEYFSDLDVDVDWYNLVWHKRHSIRYSSRSWIAINNGLKTAAALLYRNMKIDDTSCPLCHSHLEKTSHLLFECDYSFQLLTLIIPQFKNFYLRPNIIQALHFISGLYSDSDTTNATLLILHAAVYYLWNERNSRKFNGNASCVTSLKRKVIRAVFLKLNT